MKRLLNRFFGSCLQAKRNAIRYARWKCAKIEDNVHDPIVSSGWDVRDHNVY